MTKKPAPIVMLTPTGLVPVSPYDAEEMDQFSHGAEFDLVSRSKRSFKHHRTYWKALGGVVKATGKWPTSAHLHDELKLACGFRQTIIDWQTGEAKEVIDSIAFDKMTQQEFKVYFDMAIAKLSERVGYDVLAWMEG